jgi:hypothetical protein
MFHEMCRLCLMGSGSQKPRDSGLAPVQLKLKLPNTSTLLTKSVYIHILSRCYQLESLQSIYRMSGAKKASRMTNQP